MLTDNIPTPAAEQSAMTFGATGDRVSAERLHHIRGHLVVAQATGVAIDGLGFAMVVAVVLLLLSLSL